MTWTPGSNIDTIYVTENYIFKNTKLHRKRDSLGSLGQPLNPLISLLVLLISFSSRLSLQSLGRLTVKGYSFASLPWCSAVASWNKLSVQCLQEKNPYFISAHKTPLTADLFTTGTFFGGQSIHWLLFKPLYNGYFLLSPRSPLRSGSSLLILSEVSQLPPPHRRVGGVGGRDTCDDTCKSLIHIFWLHLKHVVQWRWKQFLRTFSCPCWFSCRS